MQRTLLIVGGVFNALFFLFHIFLGYQIYLIQNIDSESRALMEMLNVGGCLMIAFFAVASLAYIEELASTRLGKLVILLVVFLYGSRAVEEFVVSSIPSIAIFATCLAMTIIYLVAFFISPSAGRSTAVGSEGLGTH